MVKQHCNQITATSAEGRALGSWRPRSCNTCSPRFTGSKKAPTYRSKCKLVRNWEGTRMSNNITRVRKLLETQARRQPRLSGLTRARLQTEGWKVGGTGFSKSTTGKAQHKQLGVKGCREPRGQLDSSLSEAFANLQFILFCY